jgi:hypothetical protein
MLSEEEESSMGEMRQWQGESVWGSVHEGGVPDERGNQNSTVQQERTQELEATNPDGCERDEVEVVPGPEVANNSSDEDTVELAPWDGNSIEETATVMEKQLWADLKRGGVGDTKNRQVASSATGKGEKLTLWGADKKVSNRAFLGHRG